MYFRDGLSGHCLPEAECEVDPECAIKGQVYEKCGSHCTPTCQNDFAYRVTDSFTYIFSGFLS